MTLAELTALEQRIHKHLSSYRELGKLLKQIISGKGYLLRGYATMDEYCEAEFDFVDRHGRRLVAAARTADLLEELCGEVPASEYVARTFYVLGNNRKDLCAIAERLRQNGSSVATAHASEVRKEITKYLRQTGRQSRSFPEEYTAYEPTGKKLSDRELEIMDGISQGFSYKEIGKQIRISRQTVKNHCTSIYAKIGARNAPHAVWLVFVEKKGR